MEQQLVLKKLSDIFENTTYTQIKEHYSDGKRGRCAAGLVMSEMFGWDGKDICDFNKGEHVFEYFKYMDLVKQKTGKGVAELNDREGWTFKDFGRLYRSIGL